MGIDAALEERKKLKLEIYKIDNEGESNLDAEWARRDKLAKKVKELNRLIAKLKEQKGKGRMTRRR